MPNLNFLRNKKLIQSIVLYSSTIGAMLFGFLISILNTKYLGTEDYGRFKYIEVLFSIILLFSTFGYFYTTSFMIASEKNEKKKKSIFGTHLIIGIFTSIIFALIVFIYNIFFEELNPYILILLPLIPVIIFNNSLENMLQGSNHIFSLSALKIGPRAIYALSLVAVISIYNEINIREALILYYSSIGLIIVLIVLKTPLNFHDFKNNISNIYQQNKKIGFPIFIGSIFGVASTHLSTILVGFFKTNEDFGFYALALTISSPMAILPAIIGTIFMTEFVTAKRISPKHIKLITVISLLFFAVFIIILEPFIRMFYDSDFLPIIPITIMTSIGFLIHGYGDLFNKFLYAKGEGKKMRISSINIGISNIFFSILLIPNLGSFGAAYVKIISASIYLLTVLFFYLKKVREKSII